MAEQNERTQGKVELEVVYEPRVQLATQQSRRPLLRRVVVHNRSAQALGPMVLRITLDPEIAEPLELRLEGVPAGESLELSGVPLAIDFHVERLINQTEREQGRLRAQLVAGAQELARFSGPLEVLAYNEWPGLGAGAQTIAAFVTPNHPGVGRWLELARQGLRARQLDPGLEGYQSESPERVARLAWAVYAAVRQAGVGYANPPASFQESGQKVRTPEQIFSDKIATCLDLSVLMASALEQIGLHPLVIFVRGHALVGVWLREMTFDRAVETDPQQIYKHVRLGECLVFDSSPAASGASFDEAIKIGRAHLSNAANFVGAVDVRVCRDEGVRPLRLQREAAYQPVAAAPQADTMGGGEAPTLILPGPMRPEAAPDQSPAERIDIWKKRLLDLTMHNRLLNHRDTNNAMTLLGDFPAAIEDQLEEGQGKGLRLEPRDRARPDQSEEEVFAAARARLGQGVLRVDLTPAEFEKRAVHIYRNNRTITEESGTSALYLALGMLRWKESESSDREREAPILLIPVTLERERVGGPYHVCRSDDDPLLNQTLVEKMRTDFGMELPRWEELPRDESGVDVDGVLQAFLHAVRDVRGFDVERKAVLAIYEFRKFMLWLDLHKNTDALMANPIVRHILEGRSREERLEQPAPFVKPEEIDQKRPAHEDLSVVDADSSQLAAIFSALDGNSFVLQGPPGTGKSQTITNLIAQLLGRGKTVLFVSEKPAALQVVERRLKQVGLGPFTLELHSDKASKAQVMAQLEEPLTTGWPKQAPEWERHSEALEERRARLNTYARLLHQEGPFGESLFDAIARLCELREAPAVLKLSGERGPLPDRDAYAKMRERVEILARATEELGHPRDNPFEGASVREWSLGLQQRVEAALERAAHTGESLARATDALCEALHFEEAALQRAGRLFDEAMELVLSAPSPTPQLLKAPREQIGAQLEQAQNYLRQRQQVDARVREVFAPTLYREPTLGQERERFARWAQAFVLLAWIMLWGARRRLRAHASGDLPDNTQVLGLLQSADQVNELDAQVEPALNAYATLWGHHWKGPETSPEALARVWTQTREVRDRLARLNEVTPQLASVLEELVVRAGDRLAPGTRAHTAIEGFEAARNDYAQAVETLLTELQWPAERFEALRPPAQRERIARWQAELARLRSWCDWNARAEQVRQLPGQAPLVDALLSRTLDHRALLDAMERGLREAFVDHCFNQHAALERFRGYAHDQLIAQFRQIDAGAQRLARLKVQHTLARRLPDPHAPGEMALLQREFRKKRAHKPVRTLVAEAPRALVRLKPCMLMSPLSVARYLDPSLDLFDVVIFDEASQIPPWDAIGAIARARQAIIVGDSKQLPPTNFFEASAKDDFDEEQDLQDMESILDEAISSGVPELTLDWHYRSRHESLIAFSNDRYYNNRLHIFPSPHQQVPELGVKFVPVEGFYDRGGSRTNRAEAQAVVAEIVARLLDPTLRERSIGVVTFSQAQQQCIEELLDEERRRHPQIERFFSESDEPVFIKNLESVQGDERDVMFFSIGYGPDQVGKVTMNFGPLNREGGERRLNVAITRARELLKVFSTLEPHQIDTSRTQAVGVRHLKTFLEYAKRGPAALFEEVTQASMHDYDSPFEREVAERLRQAGWEVHTQVGVAGYRVDLGVVDPQRPGAYLLGVECDGASYHSSKNARDRDRIRQGVLENLGWTIHRIWSTDWWHDPAGQTERVVALLRELNLKPRQGAVVSGEAGGGLSAASEVEISEAELDVITDVEVEAAPVARSAAEERVARATPSRQPADFAREFKMPSQASKTRQAPATPPAEVALAEKVATAPAATAPVEYAPVEREIAGAAANSRWPESASPWRDLAPHEHLDPDGFYEGHNDATLLVELSHLVRHHGPVKVEMVGKAVSQAWGLSRYGRKIAQRIETLLQRSPEVRVVGDVAWPVKLDPATWQGFRYHDESSQGRAIDEIPQRELENALLWTLERAFGLSRDEAISETSSTVFGYSRMGSRIRSELDAALNSLIARGQVVEEEGVLRPGR
ncbi:DUF3320 domain-containing protein [Lujinxingia vulgaris]|uniref:DUF3320 domain-containing protein n=1 Tax=Lujinxingia vulgaris TaxID=2600176 RepID=A0A5C6XEJ5_9DELT|nr:DUF3320 domain-containing protein [Lujinxingia vulgaris]TXD36534.1 DUF3320 domain-containing protein [Lujinxingia vulgaris]